MIRIGSTILDTTGMTVKEYDAIIAELRAERHRQIVINDMQTRLNNLFADAEDAGVALVHTGTGELLTPDFIKLVDMTI